MSKVQELFGSMVFDDEVMYQRLPEETYTLLQNTIKKGKHLDLAVANEVAEAMKNWALEKGATHYTHWFQPMTGVTAEKHDAFIKPSGNGKVLMEFSGKELIRGEPDASSFPSGGLRATFEARGYTAWDATSYAFIKDKTLCIPTAFCSYGGEALDNKTPLLRSMERINKEALRVMKLFGNTDVKSVCTTVGPEQEYFLIDETLFNKRPDLIFTGRTLFGAPAPKGQELNDHYFGTIKPRVAEFMEAVDEELWKLGVLAKTEHNETAPSQHELAPLFTTANIAADHNQLIMEVLQKTARKFHMVCLLHEKPFEGVNGSGKHNNWSLMTDTGVNLLEPGETPYENAQFLLFLCAVIRAVDDYQDLLRISIASASNDKRLGTHEAPPSIISIYLGDELKSILEAIESDTPYGAKEKELLRVGVHTMPKFPKDTSDRNRTSPFAFTGNKFEFRMLGSSASISGINFVLNTSVAETLKQFADELEKAEDFETSLHNLIRRTIHEHSRILFNGNGYGSEWVKEAKKRGLGNYPTTPDAFSVYLSEKNIRLFTENKILSETEMRARYEVMMDNYSKVLHIEAVTMLDMVNRAIVPSVVRYARELADTICQKKATKCSVKTGTEKKLLTTLSDLLDRTSAEAEELEKRVNSIKEDDDVAKRANKYKTQILPSMDNLRALVDRMEQLTDRTHWPYPTYADMLFSIR